MPSMLPSSSLRRRAIAVVAAYALALQAILAAVVSLQVIQPADAAGVICHTASDLAPSTDEGNDPGQGRQGHQGDHCALCATVPPLLPERAGVTRPVQHPTLQLTVGTPRPLWLPRDIRSRPGKPRDPPAAA